MKVRHNTASVNTLRRFGMNQTALQKDLEKLSSGYKINKAGDDAAGLAVSESMRERIKGLDQGHNNINDGMSLLNVAEGGMEEITDMLQRMSKLAHQAVNDTYNEDNRKEIQEEINELKNEIVRIADSTEFNDIKVLKLKDQSTYTEFTKTGLPSWMNTIGKIDGDMTLGNIDFGEQDPENVDQTMFQLTGWSDIYQKFTYNFYGPNNSPESSKPADTEYMHFEYGGSWTKELSDNLGAVISFKGLADRYTPGSSTYDATKTASDLYKDVYELLGSSIGVACSTCDDEGVSEYDKHFFGFAFYGTAIDPNTGKNMEYLKSGMRYVDDNGNPTYKIANGNTLDISEITIPKEGGVPLFEFLSYQMSQNPDADSLKDAATTVAQRLFDETYNNLESYIKSDGHYNATCKDDNSMTIGIYDYRDRKVLDDDTVKVYKSSRGYCFEVPDPIWIQCSSARDDRVPLKLPYVDIDDLGISDFDVSRYIKSTQNVYDPADVAREQAERASGHIEKRSLPERHIEKVIPAHDVSITQKLPNVHGEEVKTKVGTKHIPEQKVSVTMPPKEYDVYTGFIAKPIRTEDVSIYIRPDIDVVTKAIDKISSFRAILGAQYNRLEHSRNNNEVMDENITAAESRIRDTNMAGEMSKFQKDSMLMNVTERMLGIADESTRGILDLLG